MLNNKIYHQHENIKSIVANKLRESIGPTSAVLTEVNISEEGKILARADVVMYNNSLGHEITIIEIKIKADEIIEQNEKINQKLMQLFQIHWAYANYTYLCLPKKECSTLITSICKYEKIGLVTVNIKPDDGPRGYLNKIVNSAWTKEPKKWLELALRLEKLGLPPIY